MSTNKGLYWIMSISKYLITGLSSCTLVLTYRFTSNTQPADWKGHMDGSTLRVQRRSFKG